jgi:hypothetical protein
MFAALFADELFQASIFYIGLRRQKHSTTRQMAMPNRDATPKLASR